MNKTVKTLIVSAILVSLFLTGCSNAHRNIKNHDLTRVEDETKQSLDSVSPPMYTVKVQDKQGLEKDFEFAYPWYIAIGGQIANESGTYEQAAAGQVNYSTVLGMATRKYFFNSGYRASFINVAPRCPVDYPAIQRMLGEVGYQANINKNGELLFKPSIQSSLSEKNVREHVWNKSIPPELFITGSVTEVTVGEESMSVGIVFAGIGPSTKVVRTSISGTLEITDPYTGELVVSVMCQNKISAYQIGAEAFRVVSAFGIDNEFMNVGYTEAKEMIKQQVQVELIDYLFASAFEEFRQKRPAYLTQRLHNEVGIITKRAKELAEKEGFTVVGKVSPVTADVPKKTEEVSSADIPATNLDYSQHQSFLSQEALLQTPFKPLTAEEIINPTDGRQKI